MAIIFPSLQKKERIILRMMIFILVVVLATIPLFIFYPWGNDASGVISDQGKFKPDITINFQTVDSAQVNNLEPFLVIEKEFSYVVKKKNGKQIVGKISAPTYDDAKVLLYKLGFIIVHIEEITIGRSEPFTPYYQ